MHADENPKKKTRENLKPPPQYRQRPGRSQALVTLTDSEYKRKRGDRVGLNWRIPVVTGRRTVRHVVFDTNYWKSFIHARLAVPMGDPGCLSLFGQAVGRRRQAVGGKLQGAAMGMGAQGQALPRRVGRARQKRRAPAPPACSRKPAASLPPSPASPIACWPST